MVSKLESLSVRPPTPPKDIEENDKDADETLQFLEDPFGEKPTLPKLALPKKTLLNTPLQSPSSEIDIPSSLASAKKRVIFQLTACTSPQKKAVAQSWTPTRSSPLRPLPHLRGLKPLRSILKPSDAASTPPPTDDGASADKFTTFADMLESIVKQLAQGERSSRLDAYHSLQRTMQAYEKVPDEQALKNKMSLLTQFMRRDIQAVSQTGTGPDSQLIGQALKLLLALLRTPDLITVMNEDFCAFVMDRSIQVAADASMPKLVVNTHLAVLMQQNFRPRTMTPIRVEKVMDVLDTIHERVSGFSVQAYRLRIYRKMIQQRPEIMIKHTERWFKHTVKALLSGQKDINQSALDTALSAAKTIGHDRLVTKSVLSVLNRARSDGETFAKLIAQELEKMLDGDNASMVPQIWSAVTGLLRDGMQPGMFAALGDWLKVFEKCIRSEKDAVKVPTNVALCFLLYAVNLSPSTSDTWTKMLHDILRQQLQRRVKKPEREATTSAYITLLYYALRPTASHEQLDRYWREYVATFWTPLVNLSPSTYALVACRIVSALLDGSRKPWNEQRVLEIRSQFMVQRAELPLLDPRWVRKSLPTVLSLVETLLDATPWSTNENEEDQPVKTMWLAVLKSLVEASSKEVMASSETKDAMAHIVNLLRRVWDRHTAQLALPQQKEDSWADKFCFLIETVIQKLGAFQFADKSLTRNGEDDFEVASTPSVRSRQNGPRISPLLYFVDLLINQSEGKLPDDVRLRAMKLILEPCFNIQNTRQSKLELLRDCSATVDGSLRAVVALNFWAQIAALLKSSFQERASDTNEHVSRPLGKEYEVVVEILGLGSTYILNRPRGQEVLVSFVDTVRREAGDGALVLAVVEKVSECVLKRVADDDKTSCLPYASILLRNLPANMSRRVLDQARQKLWPSSPGVGRNADFDPYNHLYGAVVSTGLAAYRDLNSEDLESTKDFVAALGASIHNCTTSLLAVYLRKTQDVIRLWVEDPEKKMQTREQPMKILHKEVVNLWREVSKAIERLPRKDGQILSHLESLITAGFVSRRRSIANVSITTWNTTFGKEESLRYPARLEQALRRLYNTVDLLLPSLDIQKGDSNDEISFYDSDTSAEAVRSTFKSPRVKASPFKIARSARKSKPGSPAVPTPGSKRTPGRQTPKVRLRHDNSQVQFEAIVSSPSNPFNQESQVLTERQKEVLERHRLAGGLFADMRAVSPEDTAPSPMQFHSDAPSADELPPRKSRVTPMKTLAGMGPMDAYLGSSPTPHARRSRQHIVSDDTSVATPTAIRTVQHADDNDDLGSSPPHIAKEVGSRMRKLSSGIPGEDVVEDSFGQRQPDSSYSMSFDEGTTIDEIALSDAIAAEDLMDYDFPTDITMSEPPSSAIDLQVTAQLDADIQAHVDATQQGDEASQESYVGVVDNGSDPRISLVDADQDGDDTEVEDSQARAVNKESEFDTSGTSRVDDSFTKPSSERGTPKNQSIRRSSRHSAVASPTPSPSGKKRKQGSAKQGKKGKKSRTEEIRETETPSKHPAPAAEAEADEETNDGDTILDTIVVEVPSPSTNKSKKRKLRSDSMSSQPDSPVVVPGSSRKRSMLRSQSSLSQVENSQDVFVRDSPAPKRARQAAHQDVSEAKSSTTKRLSHVQVAAPSKPTISTATTSPQDDTATPPPAQDTPVTATPSQSFAERVILSPRSIINQLRNLKDYLFNAPSLVLGSEEERQIDDALFDIRRSVHAAGRRGEGDA
ncbi:hypothetical protein P153DRAFT_422439 [Dothidotthia symphoricarpi CBS 119687]|uniref:Telomere-associated protein Rif1 N-terminal domain-containing protein n=1 Tax=Dothidotthia symphoricarpi CBS 119687 TaxID=1392245 RepID=A0A6A6AI39_9PLEO|nr:uncharacterized protein P153DRAFT_422439 [Dothidotthia symphoricarpi CBS 119687]KAF2130577.1 hypothetical protein P153DRAFT_422439 [Dothidotthia symphoricarpi CBS 119687]